MKREVKLKKSFVFQHDHKDCGPASLLTLVRWHGYQTSLEHLRIISGTHDKGTSALGLQQAAQELGFEADVFRASLSDLKKLDDFSILHVVKNNLQSHFILCLGQKDGSWLVADPEIGIQQHTDEQLQSTWPEGVLISLKFSGKLNLKKRDNNSFSHWFMPLLKPHKRKLILILSLGFLNSILLFSTSVFTEKLVDELLPSQNRKLILAGVITWSTLLLISLILGHVRNYGIAQFSRDFNTDLIRGFFSKLLYLPKRFFDSKKTGDLMTRMEDAEGIEETATKWIEDGFLSSFTVTISLVLLFIYDLELAMINLLLLPVLFGAVLLLRKRVKQKQRAALASHAINNSNYVDAITGIDTIKNQQLELRFSKHALAFYQSFRKKVFESDKVNMNFGLVIQFFVLTSTVMIISISSIKVLIGSLEIGNMLAIISIASIASANTMDLAFTYIDFEEAKIAFERMHELVDQKTEEVKSKYTFESTAHNVLAIRDLSFSFRGQSNALSNISMDLEQGKMTTLLGESGGGKTTLMNLISAMYSPNSGSIRFNQQSIFRDILNWRQSIGVVPQEIKVFNASFWENISLESIGTDDEDAKRKVQQLMKKHQIDFLLRDLPFGLETTLGEGGIQLSGGQKKILGLIRAIYSKPMLLLLDELSTSLDRKNLILINDLLNRLKTQIPILQITHDTLIASKSDYIYILENGKIMEQGTPDELMLSDNLYSDFFQDYQVLTN